MAEEMFQVFEWRIENFSCWNKEVHGGFILSPESSDLDYVRYLKLHPRSTYGPEQVKIYIESGKAPLSDGNLSLMGSDRSLICTKRTQIKSCNNHISSGLKFEEVVDRIRIKGDILIVRLCFRSEKAAVDRVITILEYLKISVSVDPKTIKIMKSDDTKKISLIHYNKSNYLDEMLLKAVRKEDTLEFVLELLTMSGRGVFVESQWKFFDGEQDQIRSEEKKCVFTTGNASWTFSSYLLSKLTAKAMILDLKFITGNIIEKSLKIPVKETGTVPRKLVCYFNERSSIESDSSSCVKTGDSVTDLIKDLMCLFQDQVLSDLTLKCGDVTFPVHRLILSARSPVFKTILSCDLKEAVDGRVDITDLDPSTLARFLTFLYTGAVGEELTCDSGLNLYYAADKYQVPSLKRECAAFLSSNLSISNVCDVQSFSDKHGDEELGKVSRGFVLEHYNEVLESKEWERFMEDVPQLALKTLTQLGREKHVGKIHI